MIWTSATVPSARMEKARTVPRCSRAQVARDHPMELDPANHLRPVRSPVVPLRVERESAHIDEPAVLVGEGRAVHASAGAADGPARRVAYRGVEAGELGDLARPAAELRPHVRRKLGGFRFGRGTAFSSAARLSAAASADLCAALFGAAAAPPAIRGARGPGARPSIPRERGTNGRSALGVARIAAAGPAVGVRQRRPVRVVPRRPGRLAEDTPGSACRPLASPSPRPEDR